MKGIITIIIIIAIVVAGFLLLRDGTTEDADIDATTTTEETSKDIVSNTADIDVELGDAPVDIDTTAEVIVVTYSDAGFAPKEIAIALGQTVRFVNESEGKMWVASDSHPSHKTMPEFDDKKSIGNGENYEFTFTKTGEWDYHNHVNPSAGGTVTVE